jgi:hypothetical protein
MATIVLDRPRDLVHRPGRRPPRCGVAPPAAAARQRRREERVAARCRARARSRRLAAGVGVGVAVAGALALGLVPGSDAPAGPATPVGPLQPVSASSSGTGSDPEVGGTYRAIDRALAGSGDLGGVVAGLEGAAGE